MRAHTVSTPESEIVPRESERRERELSFFAELAHALASTESAHEVLSLILDRLRMVVGCEVAAVFATAAEPSHLELTAVHPRSKPLSDFIGRSYPRADTVVERSLVDARPLMVQPDGPDALDPMLADLLGGRTPDSGMILPIRGPSGVALGALVVLNPHGRVLPVDVRFLLALADHAAIALHRARAVESSAGEGIRLQVMNTVFQATSAGLEERALLERAIEPLLTSFPLDSIEIALRDGGELRSGYQFPPGADGLPGVHRTRAQALHMRTVESGTPTVLEPEDAGSTTRSGSHLTGLPLLGQDRALGSILVARRAPAFSNQEVELLAAVGRHIGMAIELSRLFRRAAVEADELERVAAERSSALQATQEQLVRSQWFASLGEIAAGVAHDLNNALNPIVAFAELIREHGDRPETVKTYAERILMAAQGGAETVRRIQRFTRRHLGAMSFQPSAVEDLVRDAIELVRPAILERGDSIRVVESVAPHLYINTNPGELRQALLNLLKNAIDAMPNGGELRCIASGDGDSVLLSVQDTGTGMPAEIHARALEPFFTTKGAHGTGLGLAEVFGIARRHSGELELETWPGVGTTVTLRLPAAATRPDTVAEPVRRRPKRSASCRVLLVDDNVLGLEATAASLRGAGHTVQTAPNAESALRLFDDGKFDIVLSDLGLPDMNGWELIERLRSRDRSIRIGLITGWSVAENEEQLQRRGVEIVLTKPVDPDRLLEIL